MIDSKPLREGLRQLVTLQPFWGALALHMEFVRKDDQPTLCTDGKRIYYNKQFCDELSPGLCCFVIAHEVSHPFLRHLDRPFQPGGVTPHPGKTFGKTPKGKTWHYHPDMYNHAADYVINLMLRDAGFQIWPKCLIDDKYKGMTSEQVYCQLWQDNSNPPQPQPQPGAGEGSPQHADASADDDSDDSDSEDGDGGGSGDESDEHTQCDPVTGRDIMEPADDFDNNEFKEIVVKSAAIAKAQGKLPGSVAGMIKEATEPQYPVYMLLERFIDEAIRDDDQSWKRPHRDFMNRGIVMPSAFSEKISHVVVVYDTSGSVGDDDLMRFHRAGGDVIRRLQPSKLTLIQCDMVVTDYREITKASDWPRDLKTNGRGGTSFKLPFEELKKRNIRPSCLVYLTDMYGDFPTDPGYPTFWVSTTKDMKAPFGMTVYFNDRS